MIKIQIDNAMIKIKNERELLSAIRNPLLDWNKTELLILPIINEFILSNDDIDKYQGWTFSLELIKNTNQKYQSTIENMNLQKSKTINDWTFAPSLTENYECIWSFKDIAIVIHQESWLWFE